MLCAILIILLLIILYLLMLRGRQGHPGLEAFRGKIYAHRGLYGDDIPENSLAAWKAAREFSGISPP